MSAGVTFLPLAAMYIRGQWLYTAHAEKNLSGVFKKRFYYPINVTILICQ